MDEGRTVMDVSPGRDQVYTATAYALSSACPNLIGQAIDVARVAHLNDRLHLRGGFRIDGVGRSADDALVGVASAAECVVRDLGALRVSHEDDLSIGASRGIVVNGRCDSSRSLAG